MRSGLLLILIIISALIAAQGQTITISSNSSGLASSPQIGGTNNVAIFGIQVDKAAGGASSLTSIVVQLSQDPNGIFSNPRLVRSDNNASFDVADLANLESTGSLGTTPNALIFDESPGNISGFSGAANAATRLYFVVVDVEPDVPATSVQPTVTEANITAGSTVAPASLTGTNYTFNPQLITISSLNSVGANGVSTSPLVAEAIDQAIFGFSLSSNGSQTISAIKIQGNHSGKLSSFSLVRSTDANYSSTGDNATIAGLTFNASSPTEVAITGLSETITSTPQNYFLVASVDPSTDNTTTSFQGSLASSDVTENVGDVSGSATGMSYTFTSLQATVSQQSGGVSDALIGGDVDKAIFGFNLSSNGTQTIDGATFTLSADASSLELTNFELFQSATASYNGTGSVIASVGNGKLSVAGGVISVSGISASSNNYYFVRADVNSTASSATFDAELTSVTVANGSVSGTPIVHSNISITGLANTFTVINAPPLIIPGNIVSGSDLQPLAGFSVSSNGSPTLTAANFGITNASNIATFYLYRVDNVSGTLSGASVLASGGTASFSFTDNVPAGRTYYYYLLADISPVAVGSSSITSSQASVTVTGTKNSFSINRAYSFIPASLTAVADNGGEFNNIGVAEYTKQTSASPGPGTNITSVNSTRIFSITLTDDNIDGFPTTIDQVNFSLTNFSNVRAAALFDGTTNLGEISVTGGVLNFTGLNLLINSNTSKDIDLRITFANTVTDNHQMVVSLQSIAALSSTSLSGLAPYTSGSVLSSSTAGRNQIRVDATKLIFTDPVSLSLSATLPPQAGSAFSVSVATVDVNNNLDLDNSAEVALSINPSVGVTFVGGSPVNLVNGTHVFTNLTINKADTYELNTFCTSNCGTGLANTSSGAGTSVTVIIQSAGIEVTQAADLASCKVGSTNNYVDLPMIEISENDNADFASGSNYTFLLILPEGWEFKQSGTTPTMVPVAAQNIVSASFSNFVSPSIAKFTYSVSGTNKPDAISISGFKVRNVAGVASGVITRGGTGVIQGCCDDNKPLGTLTTSAGMAGDFTVEATPGEPTISPTTTSFSVYAKPVILNGQMPVGAPVTGAFSGPGVTLKAYGAPINGDRYTFYPSTLNDGDHDITFEYTGAGGCISTVVKTFKVFSGAITNLETSYCAGNNDNQNISVNPLFIPPDATVVQEGGVDQFSLRIPDIKYIKEVENNGGTLTVTVLNHGFTDGAKYWIFIGYGFSGADAPYGYLYNEFQVSNVTENTFDITANVTGEWDKLYGEVYLNVNYYLNVDNLVNNGSSLTLTVPDHGFLNGARPFLVIYGMTSGGESLYGFYEVKNATQNTFDIDVIATGSFSGGYVYLNWYRLSTFRPNITLLNTRLSNVNSYDVGYFVKYNWCVGFGCDRNIANSQGVTLYALPNATFSGLDPSYCVNDATPKVLTGNLNQPDGQFTILPNIGLVDNGTDNYTATFLPSAPGLPTETAIKVTYTLTDARGCTNSLTKETVIHNVPTVSAGSDQIICNGGTPATLGGAPTASSVSATQFTFSWAPSGSLSDAAAANPMATPTANTNYTVMATDEFGCSASDVVQVTVNTPATVNAGPASTTICENTSLTLNTLSGATFGGSASSATWGILATGPGTGDFRDNSSTNYSFGGAKTFAPSAADITARSVIITLTTNDPDGDPLVGCPAAIDQVTVNIHPRPEAPKVLQSSVSYCVNENLQDLNALGTSIRWYSNPALTSLVLSSSNLPIKNIIDNSTDAIYHYYVTDTNPDENFAGCESPATAITVTINPLPSPNFSAQNFCIGDAMEFDASSSSLTYNNGLSGSITEYEWFFNDGNTLAAGSGTIPDSESHGGITTGTYINPAHKYAAIGAYNVRLRTITSDGCASTIDAVAATGAQLRVGPVPETDFNYHFVCKDDNTVFLGSANNVLASQISSYDWNFGDSNTSSNATPNTTHTFGSIGSYDVSLSVTTNLGCVGTVVKSVPILPYINSNYFENFQNGPGGWVPQAVVFTPENEGMYSWELAAPSNSFGDIKKDNAGDFAWFTRSSAISTYYNAERSVLNGPCIDVRGIERPVIGFDYWSSTDAANDGAYMEVSTDGGLTWEKLGNVGTGLQWYNMSAVKGLTRVLGIGQNVGQDGWSGKTNQWVTARMMLDDFKNEGKLRIRFVFGSNPDNPAVGNYDGFAFDNFELKSRNRIMLVENFTNSAQTANNDAYNTFKDDLSSDELVKIQYHTGLLQQQDELYLDNNRDIDARVAYYGLTNEGTIPKAFLDGNSQGDFISPANWTFDQFSNRTLFDAPYKIGIVTQPSAEGNLKISVSITATEAITNDGKIPVLYVGVIEKSVDGNENVLRKLLPSAAGRPLPLPIPVNTTITVDDLVWTIDNPNINLEDLAVVAFIQDMKTREVYQASAVMSPDNLPSVVTGLEPALASQVRVYPNPADEAFQIALPEKVRQSVPFTLYDSFGRSIYESTFENGSQHKTVGTKDLRAGVYILQLETSKGSVRKKVMIVHD